MSRIKIFISSVQNEFAEERRQIADYIRQDALFSMYFEPFLFEELPAQDKSAQIAYLEQAAKADVYLLLLGKRYGYVDAEGISPTEREYDTATASHAYRIAFIKEMQEREPKEELFKQKIDDAVILAEDLQSLKQAQLLTDYVLLSDAFLKKEYEKALKILSEKPKYGLDPVLVPVARAWIMAAKGQYEEADRILSEGRDKWLIIGL